MTFLLSEMTRDEIQHIASHTIAVLPTASIEQHGPHLPVGTDSLLCETVAHRAAEQAASQTSLVVAPILYYGNAHHHYPFPGVLSLTSHTFMAAVTEVLEGLVRSGFRKLVVLNGHDGNTDANAVIGLDLVHRLGRPVSIATSNYWDIARAALVDNGFVSTDLIPGHAGRFETALVMAIRPDLVNQHELAKVADTSQATGRRIASPVAGVKTLTHGAWAAGPGYTDNPGAVTVDDGKAILEIIVRKVADFLIAFNQRP